MSDFTSAKASHRHGVISVLVALPFVSLTGLFGKFLTFSPLLIVQGRTVFAFGALLLALFFLRKQIFFSDLREWLWLALSGSILGVHWIAFFQAIQVSTVAIGLLSFASYPLFTTLLEPLFFREPLRVRNVIAALIVIFKHNYIRFYFSWNFMGFDGRIWLCGTYLNQSGTRQKTLCVIDNLLAKWFCCTGNFALVFI
jgi:uncharacterized membrane protein